MNNNQRRRPFGGAAVLLLMVMVVVAALTEAPRGVDAGLSCPRITGLLIPCLGYLTKGGRFVPRSCCGGVRTVVAASRTTADRRGACKCLKAASLRLRVRAAYARTLPRRCRLSIPYVISPTIDCNRIR